MNYKVFVMVLLLLADVLRPITSIYLVHTRYSTDSHAAFLLFLKYVAA